MTKRKVLLVEDNPVDVALTIEAIQETDFAQELQVMEDGEAAFGYLQEVEGAKGRLPDLVLLDLDMPRLSGFELLRKVKQDKKLRHLPVVIFTSSSDQKEVATAYREQANCFVTKPIDYQGFAKSLRSIEAFWFRTATLPPPQG